MMNSSCYSEGAFILSKITPEILAFIEEIGLDFERQNLPRVAGRIMGLLMVSSSPLSSQQIASTLQISLGAVSTNINLMLRDGLVEKKTLIGDRMNYYVLPSDYLEQELIYMITAAFTRQAIFKKHHDAVKEDDAVDKRFKDWIEGTDYLIEMYERYLAELRASKSENHSVNKNARQLDRFKS